MNDQVAQISIVFLYVLMAFMVVRAILSWTPLAPEHPLVRIVHQVTEPLVEPVRKILPRTGMFDFSVLVVVIVLQIVIQLVRQAAN